MTCYVQHFFFPEGVLRHACTVCVDIVCYDSVLVGDIGKVHCLSSKEENIAVYSL